MDKNIRVVFTQKADTALADITKRYNLVESQEALLEKAKERKFHNVVVINRLTKSFVKEEISTEQFLSSLKENLGISTEATKSLAQDIIKDLIPLLDKVPEDELEQYNLKKYGQETGAKTEEQGLSEAVREKIFPLGKEAGAIKSKEEPFAPPFVKKPVIRDVEEMAKMRQAEKKFARPEPEPTEKTEKGLSQAPPKLEEPAQNPSDSDIEAGKEPKEDDYRETVD